MKLLNLIDEWLYDYHKDNIRSQTFLRYECAFNNYISPDEISNKNIKKITPHDIQKFINRAKKIKSRKTKNYLSASNVNIIITVLKMAFEYAIESRFLKYNPCIGIKRLPKKKTADLLAYTIQEQLKIEKYLMAHKNPEYFGIILCLYTGLRIGELMALEWSDIDFENGFLKVDKTTYLSKDQEGHWDYETNIPKTRTSIRVIPLNDNILYRLDNLREVSNSKYVISKRDGRLMSANLYRTRFHELTKKIGVRSLNFHTLRHTFATRALESGMDVKSLSEIMGHNNASITLNIYAHSMTDHKKTMMNKIPVLVSSY